MLSTVLVVCLQMAFSYTHYDRYQGNKCERITIPMCLDMKYNLTRMPNLVGHTNQKDAAIEVHEFLPLVQIRCSSLLKFFLCSLYAPMCTDMQQTGVDTMIVPACRSMCQKVRSKCEPVMKKFNFTWPSTLDCVKLPEKADSRKGVLCMEAPALNTTDDAEIDPGTLGRIESNPDLMQYIDQIKDIKSWKDNLKNQGDKVTPAAATNNVPLCPERYVYVDKLSHRNSSCAPRCNIDVLFKAEDKKFAEIWTMVWATLCCLSTTITVLTFVIDTSRFKYPERPIIFLSMCYAIYSIAFVIRAITGPHAISCDQGRDGRQFLIQEGLESTWCIIVFLILYFFGMAGSLWWVILTVTWFLAAGRKWGQEAIEALSSYFHLAAWAIPAIKTIVILTMRRVDGDELTGLCYVGNQDTTALIGFVLVPLIVYLLAGTIFLLSGFVALFRIRNNLKQDGTNIRKLEKLMAKIGVFSVLYTLPATCVIGCYFYERVNFESWREDSVSRPCKTTSDLSRDCHLDNSIPSVEVYMLKYFMSLVVGITCGMWIWSHKTLTSWSKFCSSRFARRKSNYSGPGHSGYQPAPVVVMKPHHGHKHVQKSSTSRL
ncbi:hypothetical protein ACJMK2_029066 [Sinanodonta woodiana]|uniref:Uncharacterized protein n=1 Tax=Sinanodonta woodiana TaxID=1069815 RepID=A0ABD3X9H0_SINWO